MTDERERLRHGDQWPLFTDDAHETSASYGRRSDRPSGSGLDAMKQGLRNDRNVFQRFIRDLEERSPESAKSHIIRTSRAVIEDIDNLFAALAGSSDPEAVGLDVERLARAMARCAEVGPPAHINPDDAEEHWPSYVAEAEEYAREYAALTEAKPESPA
jgi:hypothetical protein